MSVGQDQGKQRTYIFALHFATVYINKGRALVIADSIMSLGKVYYDPKHPAVFGSLAKLVKASTNKKRDVEERLSSQNTYTLHKPVRKKFPRNPYIVTNVDDVREMVLADLNSLSKYNKYKYLLNVIDMFSRYVWRVSLKEKTSTSISSALKSLF